MNRTCGAGEGPGGPPQLRPELRRKTRTELETLDTLAHLTLLGPGRLARARSQSAARLRAVNIGE